jgi:AcrR family transcriptional regulator
MSESTRPLKSDLTRARILAAAERLFAEQGYERTTIRDVAARAEIDPSMVMRYFGSKDGLFAKAAAFDLRLPDLQSVSRAEIGSVLVSHFLDMWEGDNANAGLVILLRAAASNEGAAETIREILGAQILPAMQAIAPGPLAPVRAGLVAAQMLGLALGRYILKLPPVTGLSRADVVRYVGPTVQHYVNGELE